LNAGKFPSSISHVLNKAIEFIVAQPLLTVTVGGSVGVLLPSVSFTSFGRGKGIMMPPFNGATSEAGGRIFTLAIFRDQTLLWPQS
jgi:hypothetical protein